MSSLNTAREIVVRGIVIPIAWDRYGQPLRVAILTPDEGEYPVAPRGLGRRLFRFIREEIKARVAIEEDADGDELIRLLSFTIVKHSVMDTPPPVADSDDAAARSAEPGGGNGA